MANYYGQGRSNYFAVKNAEAFLEEMAKYPLEIITQERDGETLYGFMDADSDGGGNIDQYFDADDGEPCDIDWETVFRTHLADGWVAVVMSIGSEKYRFLNGVANAYNNRGECLGIDLSDIYVLADHLGTKPITHACY